MGDCERRGRGQQPEGGIAPRRMRRAAVQTTGAKHQGTISGDRAGRACGFQRAVLARERNWGGLLTACSPGWCMWAKMRVPFLLYWLL
jgi:hypothetical protein